MNIDSSNAAIDSLTHKCDSIANQINELLSSGVIEELKHIHSNTNIDFIDDGLNLLAIVSITIAIIALVIETVTWFGITGTKQSIIDEAEKNRVDKECQYRLFQDIIRHLYRNRVCTETMELKTERRIKTDGDKTYKNFYPSEEHILKLKLLPSDIHLEEYYRDVNTYHRLHQMELLLRNYNVEIDSAHQHIPSANVPDETKKRDYDTLNFKTSFLTVKLVELMDVMWPELDNLQEAKNLIYESQQNNYKGNKDNIMKEGKDHTAYEESIRKVISGDKMRSDKYITDIFKSDSDKEKFLEGLAMDLLIECGENNRGEEKIHIIKRI